MTTTKELAQKLIDVTNDNWSNADILIGKEIAKEYLKLLEEKGVTRTSYIKGLLAEIEVLKSDLKMCREIGVEQQRQVSRKQYAEYLKSLEREAVMKAALEKAKDRLQFISDHGLKLTKLKIEPGCFESDVTIKLINEALQKCEGLK